MSDLEACTGLRVLSLNLLVSLFEQVMSLFEVSFSCIRLAMFGNVRHELSVLWFCT